VAQHVRGLPGHRWDQRGLLARLQTGRGQHVETLPAPSRPVDDRIEVAARRAQRRARLPHLDLRPQGSQGVLPVRRRPVDSAVGPNPRFHPLEFRRGHLELRRDIDNVRNDPDRVGTAPENIVVLAHYHPELVEAVRPFRQRKTGFGWEEKVVFPSSRYGLPEEALQDPAAHRRVRRRGRRASRARRAASGGHPLRPERDTRSRTGPRSPG